jgi:hypothetical protein
MINFLRRNIGTIASSIGLVLLVILTFGDIAEISSAEYWESVGGNLASIGILTVGLTLIQVVIKQGVSEQALSKGLGTDRTQTKYKEHSGLIEKNREKHLCISYFLDERNERETKQRRRIFIANNGFRSEEALLGSGEKRLIRKYRGIRTNITGDSITWASTQIVYKKDGKIEKLEEYRERRAVKGVFKAVIVMLATTFIAWGLFLDAAETPFWQKLVKFFTYIISMALSSIFDISANWEKGAFGVPNELDEINKIWKEFELWTVPEHVQKEIGYYPSWKIKELNEYEEENAADGGASVQKEPAAG